MKPLLILLVSALVATGAELRVAAAASLAESVTEIAKVYREKHGVTVTPVFAGSNVLARQIEQGAPLDVFLSADEATMDKVSEAGLVRDVRPLLTNSLVVVIPEDSTSRAKDAGGLVLFGKIAIGDPAAVPAGVYAKAWLTKAGVWPEVQKRCIGTENVRAALAAVEAGNVDAAIVYKTDAAISGKVKVLFGAPADEAPPVVYPAAICTATKHPDEAARFAGFLKSGDAAKIFAARGFGLVEEK